jgi:hemerythrin-like domain-containing protein
MTTKSIIGPSVTTDRDHRDPDQGAAMSENPTDQLRQEHELVLLVVEAMEREVAFIGRTGQVHADDIAKMVDFTRHFTDGCHHAKEEQVLFPLLERTDPAAGGPVSVMLSEHEAGRAAIGTIAANLPAAGTDPAARRAVAENLALYAQLLRLHINKENMVLFPLADRVLGEQDRRELTVAFERVETEETGLGAHERYHELARELAAGPSD